MQRFLTDGQLDVLGNSLGTDDLRLFYQFTGSRAAELSQQYETQAEKDVSIFVLVLIYFSIIPFVPYVGASFTECRPGSEHER